MSRLLQVGRLAADLWGARAEATPVEPAEPATAPAGQGDAARAAALYRGLFDDAFGGGTRDRDPIAGSAGGKPNPTGTEGQDTPSGPAWRNGNETAGGEDATHKDFSKQGRLTELTDIRLALTRAAASDPSRFGDRSPDAQGDLPSRRCRAGMARIRATGGVRSPTTRPLRCRILRRRASPRRPSRSRGRRSRPGPR